MVVFWSSWFGRSWAQKSRDTLVSATGDFILLWSIIPSLAGKADGLQPLFEFGYSVDRQIGLIHVAGFAQATEYAGNCHAHRPPCA